MSKRKRKHLTADFKDRIAKEALEKEKTIEQIAQENDIVPAQVSTWKKELEERLVEIFERKGSRDEAVRKEERRTWKLERKVSQLVIEKDFPGKSANSSESL